jgi:hypothetical protein
LHRWSRDKQFVESLTSKPASVTRKYEIDGVDGGTNTWTWKAGGSWEPGYGVKIRGNYSKAVRAPNLGELFTRRCRLASPTWASILARCGSGEQRQPRTRFAAQGAPAARSV